MFRKGYSVRLIAVMMMVGLDWPVVLRWPKKLLPR